MAEQTYVFLTSAFAGLTHPTVEPSRLRDEVTAVGIVTALGSIHTIPTSVTFTYLAPLSVEDEAKLLAVVEAHTGEPVIVPNQVVVAGTVITQMEHAQGDGTPVFAQAPRDGSEWVLVTHNFCDKCTWFGDSVRVTAETLTDSGDGLTFESAHTHWIDMVTGRMHNDDFWVALQQEDNPTTPHGYAWIVKVDGVEKTPCPIFKQTGGDYWVSPEDGTVTFLTAQTGAVTADYSYATTSTYYVRPRPGTTLIIEEAECDFSLDIEMTTGIAYSSWQYIPEYQQYFKGMEVLYKRAQQIVAEARGCYPMFDAVGATAAQKQAAMKEFRLKYRGMKNDTKSAPLEYKTAKRLQASLLQEVRVYLTDDAESMSGEYTSMTFRCTVE